MNARGDRDLQSLGDHVWVSFSDILLTLVCAVLFLRTLHVAAKGSAQERQQFENRMQMCEATADEVRHKVQTAASGLQVLQQALGLPSSEGSSAAKPLAPAAANGRVF